MEQAIIKLVEQRTQLQNALINANNDEAVSTAPLLQALQLNNNLIQLLINESKGK